MINRFTFSTVRKSILFLFLGFIFSTISSQIPIEKYRDEILKLKSEADIEVYWHSLYSVDQDTLLKLPTDDITKYDSLSTTLMIKTALMFEVHGRKVYKKNNVVPVLNFTHNYLSEASLVFWSIINQCVEVGGQIDTFATGFPAYQLEAIANNFYKYSLSGQQDKHEKLVDNIEVLSIESVASRLEEAYVNQKRLRVLNIKEVVGQWFIQPFKNFKEDYCFEIVILEDNNTYIKHKEYLQKLVPLDSEKIIETFKIENEPFGWYYKLDDQNHLKMLDSNNSVLIEYTQCN